MRDDGGTAKVDGKAQPLALYSHNWFQRHRAVCLIAFVVFTYFYGVAFALFGRFMPVAFVAPIVAMFLFVIGLLPANDRAPTKALEGLLFAMIIGLLVWPDYLALAVGNLPWITLLRIIVFPMGLLFLLSLSVSPSFKSELLHRLNAVKPVWVMMIGIIIIGLITLPLSNRMGASINRYVILLFYWAIPFFVSVYVFAKPRRIVWLTHWLWGIATFVCFLGLWEWRNSQVPWAGKVPSFLRVEDESVQRVLAGSARTATGIYRVQSKFTTSLGLAEFISYALPFILHIIFTTKSQIVRLSCLATLPLILFVNVKTDSRIGFIGLSMSVLLYGLGWAILRWRRDRESILAPAIVLSYPAVMVAAFLSTFFVSRIRAQVWGNGPQAASNETRRQMYEQGIPAMLKEPWGHGIGQAGSILGFRSGNGVLTLDTYYITIGLDFGVLGFLLYYGMFGLTIWRSYRAIPWAPDRDTLHLLPIAVTLANFFVIKSVFSQIENHPLIFCILGAAIALLSRVYDAVPEARPGHRVGTAVSVREALT